MYLRTTWAAQAQMENTQQPHRREADVRAQKKQQTSVRTTAAAKDAMHRCEMIDERIRNFIRDVLPTLEQQDSEQLQEQLQSSYFPHIVYLVVCPPRAILGMFICTTCVSVRFRDEVHLCMTQCRFRIPGELRPYQGNKYCMVMRNFKTGYFKLKMLRRN